MSEQRTGSATPAPAGGSAGVKGLLRVGDHVGLSAAQAAQAIRRAGLRPGLERCLGYPEQQTGLVVEQDPPGGTELARNALVRIFVAAPGGSGQPDTQVAGSDIEPVEAPPPDGARQQDAGLGEDELETPPVEHGPARAAGCVEQSESTAPEGPLEGSWVSGALDEPASCESGGSYGPADGEPAGYEPERPTEEQLLVRAGALFAANAARERRRWPWWSLRWPLGGLRGRSGLARAAWALLALWLLVALVTAVIGGGGGARVSHGAQSRTRQRSRQRRHTGVREPLRGGRLGGAHSLARGGGGRVVLRRRGAGAGARRSRPSPAGSRAPGGASAVSRRGAAPRSGPVPSGSAAAPVPAVPGVPVPLAEPEQVGGGPFSP